MGLSKLKSQVVFLDTAPLIYFIEGNSQHQKSLTKLFAAYDKGEFTLISSVITLLEVLVQPLRLNRADIVEQYKTILTEESGIELFDINAKVAGLAAELRAKYNLKTPDAIQLATAIENGAKFFLTNDLRLQAVKEIEIMTLADL